MIFNKLLTNNLNKFYSFCKSHKCIKALFIKNSFYGISCQTRYLSMKTMSEIQLLKTQNLWLSVNRCEDLYGKYFLAERQYQEISAHMFSHLSSDKSLVETIINEYYNEKYSTERVPSTLRPIDVKILCEMNDLMRVSYINKLFKDELQKWFENKHEMKRKTKVINDRLRKLAELNADVSGIFNSQKQLIYEFNHNCLTLQFNDINWKKYLTHKLSSAALFGNKLVIDCGFDNMIELYKLENIINFINKLVDYNCYETKESFDLYFCNINFKSDLFECLLESNHNITQKEYGFNLKRESYLDLFPKQRLIYISQYSNQTIDEFDNEAVYVLPAITPDKAFEAGIKAKKEGIKVCRLPLNENGFFSKNASVEFLTPREITAILHDISYGCHWINAFHRNINKDFISFFDDIIETDRIRYRKIKSKKLERKVPKSEFNI